MQVGQTYIFQAADTCGAEIKGMSGNLVKILRIKNDKECIIQFETGGSMLAFASELKIAG